MHKVKCKHNASLHGLFDPLITIAFLKITNFPNVPSACFFFFSVLEPPPPFPTLFPPSSITGLYNFLYKEAWKYCSLFNYWTFLLPLLWTEIHFGSPFLTPVRVLANVGCSCYCLHLYCCCGISVVPPCCCSCCCSALLYCWIFPASAGSHVFLQGTLHYTVVEPTTNFEQVKNPKPMRDTEMNSKTHLHLSFPFLAPIFAFGFKVCRSASKTLLYLVNIYCKVGF